MIPHSINQSINQSTHTHITYYLTGNENAALKEAVENSHRLREKTLEQVRKYESMSNALERDNSEVKTALYVPLPSSIFLFFLHESNHHLPSLNQPIAIHELSINNSYQVELELNKALLSRDSLKQRLNTVTDYWGNPKKQPQKQGQQMVMQQQQLLQGGGSTALSLLLQEDNMMGGGVSHGKKKKKKQQHGALSRITREVGRADDRGSHSFSQLHPISTTKRGGGGGGQHQQQKDHFMPNNELEGSTFSSLGVGSLVFDRDY
jgi:hypothetical protein